MVAALHRAEAPRPRGRAAHTPSSVRPPWTSSSTSSPTSRASESTGRRPLQDGSRRMRTSRSGSERRRAPDHGRGRQGSRACSRTDRRRRRPRPVLAGL